MSPQYLHLLTEFFILWIFFISIFHSLYFLMIFRRSIFLFLLGHFINLSLHSNTEVLCPWGKCMWPSLFMFLVFLNLLLDVWGNTCCLFPPVALSSECTLVIEWNACFFSDYPEMYAGWGHEASVQGGTHVTHGRSLLSSAVVRVWSCWMAWSQY